MGLHLPPRLSDVFQIASGTIAGRVHRKLGNNNQDAYNVSVQDEVMVVAVCDGCAAGKSSEVGSRLGARFAVEFCRRQFARSPFDATLLHDSLLAWLKSILTGMADKENWPALVEDYFLFTILGCIVRPDDCWVFSMGDGILQLNGETRNLDRGDTPDFITREIVGGPPRVFSVVHLPTAQLQNLLICTDGAEGIIKYKDHFTRDDEQVGPLEQFAYEDALFSSPDAFNHRLMQIAQDTTYLGDDTTIIALRRWK